MISVSIVTYRTPKEELDRCLQCLHASKLVASVRIVDNEKGQNIGYGAGHNIAIREAQEEYHLVVNSDVSFPEGTLEYLYEYMERNKDVGQSIPRVTYPDGRLQYVCRMLPTPFDLFLRRFLPSSWFREQRERYTLAETGYDHEMNVPYHMGCFMFFRRSALEEIAIEKNGRKEYFDERYFLYPEDIDITRRMHRKYRTMFVPGVTIVHNHRAASYHSARMACVHIYNMCKYFNKWGWFVDRERTEFNEKVLLREHLSIRP